MDRGRKARGASDEDKKEGVREGAPNAKDYSRRRAGAAARGL
jgi:hypothetical protein